MEGRHRGDLGGEANTRKRGMTVGEVVRSATDEDQEDFLA
jgi:hypothetical protein